MAMTRYRTSSTAATSAIGVSTSRASGQMPLPGGRVVARPPWPRLLTGWKPVLLLPGWKRVLPLTGWKPVLQACGSSAGSDDRRRGDGHDGRRGSRRDKRHGAGRQERLQPPADLAGAGDPLAGLLRHHVGHDLDEGGTQPEVQAARVQRPQFAVARTLSAVVPPGNGTLPVTA